MFDPMIIMCAPNGARRSKLDHSQLPITPAELADCAEEIVAAGASMMHMHVRDADGGHTLNVDAYRRAIDAVEDRVGADLIIQVTTESVGLYSSEDQMAMVRELGPDSVSLALREICPDGADLAEFFSWLGSEKVFPQIILYGAADIARFGSLHLSGVFDRSDPFTLYVIGSYQKHWAGNSVNVQQSMEERYASNAPWAACCFGLLEYEAAVSVAHMGGHIRVGFENNIWRADGRMASNNAELVRAACDSAQQVGRKIATANDARRILGMPVKGKQVAKTIVQ